MGKVKENDTVKIHYTGKLDNGEVFDSSLQREPIQVTLGQGSLIPGLEKGLIDMEPNETKTVKVLKEEAYGDIQEELFHMVKKSDLPEDMAPEVGMGLLAKNPDGTENKLRVAAVKEDHIIVDANHPLAGQDLIFELQLVDIQ